MKLVGLCLLFSSVFVTASGLFGLGWSPDWDTLRVTFGVNLFSKWTFAKLPLTKSDATKAGFQQIGDASKCSGEFQGHRFLKDSDPAVVLLFDVNGNVAGIQTSFADSRINTDEAKKWFRQHPMFDHEKLPLNASDIYHTLTAYLVKPSTICSTGRTQEEIKGNLAGNDLYLKNGTTNVLIPKNQDDIGKTNWTLGKCFPAMGVHYWYNTSKDMNCDYFQPYFLLYNHKTLTGFGFAAYGYFDSKRYEHPGKAVFSKFMKVIPDCLNEVADKSQLSTMHVYMNAKPWNLMC